jgi:hypothetical protein
MIITSFETLKNITKCRQTYLSIRMYFGAIIFQMQSTYTLSRAVELPGQSVYMVKYSSPLGLSDISRLFLPGIRQGELLASLHLVNSHPVLLLQCV